MTDHPVWPPAPEVANTMPIGPYDDILASFFQRDDITIAGRIGLIKAFRETTGLPLRDSNDIVEEYCNRHGLFPIRRGGAWLYVGIVMIFVATLGGFCFFTILTIIYGSTRSPALLGLIDLVWRITHPLMMLSFALSPIAAFGLLRRMFGRK